MGDLAVSVLTLAREWPLLSLKFTDFFLGGKTGFNLLALWMKAFYGGVKVDLSFSGDELELD